MGAESLCKCYTLLSQHTLIDDSDNDGSNDNAAINEMILATLQNPPEFREYVSWRRLVVSWRSLESLDAVPVVSWWCPGVSCWSLGGFVVVSLCSPGCFVMASQYIIYPNILLVVFSRCPAVVVVLVVVYWWSLWFWWSLSLWSSWCSFTVWGSKLA